MDSQSTIRIPDSLEKQIGQYRRAARRLKLSEVMLLALTAVLVGFLIVFGLERWFETSVWFRGAILCTALAAVGLIPLAWYRWVFRFDSNASVAQLLRRYQPSLGASLQGAIELADNAHEQSRSRTLCEAALNQVAESFRNKDLLQHLPPANRAMWGRGAIAATLIAAVTIATLPYASWNSFQRLLFPFSGIPRFTFAKLAPLPQRLVVPFGEDFKLPLSLASESILRPQTGTLRLAGSVHVEPLDHDGNYPFSVPGLRDPSQAQFIVGDSYSSLLVEPAMRPELEKLTASIQLPEYLQLPARLTRDLRGGSLSVLRGSQVELASQTSKPISSATANGVSLPVEEGGFKIPSIQADSEQVLALNWLDVDGLEAKADFPLSMSIHEDEAPIIFGEGLPKTQILLETEQIQFLARAADDFGVKHIGLEWKAIGESTTSEGQQGESMLLQGSPSSTTLEAKAVFQAAAMKIPSRLVEVRLFAEDFNPTRGRIYSSPTTLRILTPAEHADWLLEQIGQWQRESLEVRDRELQLLAANRQLRNMPDDELQSDQGRARIEQQAALEQNNGRRLASLNTKGEELLRLAAKNPELDPNHLESWAQMHQVLRDIASNRMPSVSDLLKKSAKAITAQEAANQGAAASTAANAPQVGTVHENPGAQQNPGEASNNENAPATTNNPASKMPSITDQESSHSPESAQASSPPAEATPPSTQPPAGLSLPSTTLAGGAPSPSSNDSEDATAESPPPNAAEDLAEAVRQQEALLAEFEKVADRLNGVMANLEGSTLIKRLKAASRTQLEIAEQTSLEVGQAFGVSEPRLESEQKTRLQVLRQREEEAAAQVATIVDDLKGFNERKPSPNYDTVLTQMKNEAVYDSLRQLAARIMQHQGLAVAEAEYWSDTLDRWAEDILEDPSSGEGKNSSSKSSQSLPPGLILEVMQVLEQEMNLRERTRVAEQAKSASSHAEYASQVEELSSTQLQLKERVAETRKKIRELPDGETAFQDELGMLSEVDIVMYDAFSILREPNTGAKAIAAETEAIELLLRTQRASSQKSSGGGGTTAGGGGDGSTEAPALALIGAGINPLENREDRGVSQETGSTGKGLPEEYRSGLDEYFEQIERERARP